MWCVEISVYICILYKHVVYWFRTALCTVWTLLPFNSSTFVGVQLSTTSPHHDARISGSTTVGMQLVPWSNAFDSWSSTKWPACDPWMHLRRPFTHVHSSCKPGESKLCWHISSVTLNNVLQVVNQSPREYSVFVAYPNFWKKISRLQEGPKLSRDRGSEATTAFRSSKSSVSR